MKNIEIIGVGMAIPDKVVTNEDFAEKIDTSDEWIRKRTGIAERRFIDEEKGETGEMLAIDAAKKAIEDAGIDASQIGVCIAATVTSRYITPSLSCVVQKELGLREDIPVLDVNAACSGFIYGLEVARGLMNAKEEKYGLVIGCEILSRVLDMEDRSTCVLFGDAAGAGVIRLSDDAKYESVLGARGGYQIMVDGAGPVASHVRMEGQEVFKFAVEALPKCIRQLQEKSGLGIDDVDQVICHQANSRIIDHCVHKLKADPGKFYKNMDRYGNTSAASVPVALTELVANGAVKRGSMVMLVGFGGGLTWAGALIRYGGSDEEVK